MRHADRSILAGTDEAQDPATHLFLTEHLRECRDCRELRRKVGHAEQLIAAPSGPTALPARRDVPVRSLGRLSTVVIAVALLVGAAVGGTALRAFREGTILPVAGAPTPTAVAADWRQFPTVATTRVDLRPIPPWRTAGTAQVALASNGDLVIGVTFLGPDEEVRRPNTGAGTANLIWHLIEGSCEAHQRNEPGHNVVARWTVEPQPGDTQQFSRVIPKGDLGDMGRPHVLAAFRNGGGGPLYVCGDIPSFVGARAPVFLPAPATVPASAVIPSDWERRTLHDLVIPLPPGWQKTLDTTAKSDRPEPEPPQIIAFEDRGATDAGARFVTVWLWQSTSVEELVRTRYPGGPSRTVQASRPMREQLGASSWSEPSGASGTSQVRHLFVQIDRERVVDVIVSGPRIAGSSTDVTPEMRRIQETIAFNTQALPATGCARTRSTDASGVITVNGQTGILDRTYASSRDNDFVMVRRGAKLGDRVALRFDNVGNTAPATWVAYDQPAEQRQNPWGDVVFRVGVKPIGFENSCWRLIVDGTDTGLVLFVGP